MTKRQTEKPVSHTIQSVFLYRVVKWKKAFAPLWDKQVEGVKLQVCFHLAVFNAST